jgi:hypothetical protein
MNCTSTHGAGLAVAGEHHEKPAGLVPPPAPVLVGELHRLAPQQSDREISKAVNVRSHHR